MKKELIIEKVIALGRKSAILSSRGYDVSDIDAALSELYKKSPEAYKIGYKEVEASFGY